MPGVGLFKVRENTIILASLATIGTAAWNYDSVHLKYLKTLMYVYALYYSFVFFNAFWY